MFLTVADMVAAFGEEEMLQIAGVGPRDERALDEPKIVEAIVHAQGVVVGYVRDRWGKAEAEGSALLKGLAADIARWRLRGRGGQSSAMNETVQKRYDEAIARLKDIAAGKLTLDLTGSAPAAEAAAAELRITAAMPPARGPSLLEGYR